MRRGIQVCILMSLVPLSGCIGVAGQVGAGLMTSAQHRVFENVQDKKAQKEEVWEQKTAAKGCSDIRAEYVKYRDANLLTGKPSRRVFLLRTLKQKRCKVPS